MPTDEHSISQWAVFDLRKVAKLQETNESYRKAIGQLASALIESLMAEKFEDGTSVLAYVLDTDRELRNRLFSSFGINHD
jgi:hypothetical protein